MIKIKLLPRGKKHQITYRIVVAEQRSKSDGKCIDDLGFYTPQTKTLNINTDKLTDWQKKVAQLNEGVDKLLNHDKYPKKIKKKSKVKPVKSKPETKSEDSPQKTSESPSEETQTETEVKTE